MQAIQIHSFSRNDRPILLSIAHVTAQHLASTGMLTDSAAAVLLPGALAAAPDWYEFDGLTLTYLDGNGLPGMVEKWLWPSIAGYSGFTCVRLDTGAEIARFPGETAPAVLVQHLE